MAIRPDGLVVLPTNPNGVVFAAQAQDVMGGRPWPEVQRIGARALTKFHEHSALSAVVSWSYRMAIDRKNRSTPKVIVVFIFDGPATASDLAVLDDHMRNSVVHWSISQIERVPQDRANSIMIRGGELLQLWDIDSGQPVERRLTYTGREIGVTAHRPDQLTEQDFMKGVRHTKARSPRYEDHNADLERMRLVFAQHYSQRIVEVDGQLRDGEGEFLDAVFPAHLMKRLGLDDPTSALHWLEQATEQLPRVLGHHDKLAMVGLFFSACYSDGSLDAREMRLLREAGEALGLTRPQVASYLERFW